MSLTNCGSKQVRKMFNRDRAELEKERFLADEEKQAEKQTKLIEESLKNGDE